MNAGETASRIVWLHDEMVVELKLVPSTKYPIPYVMSWWEILAAKAKAKLVSRDRPVSMRGNCKRGWGLSDPEWVYYAFKPAS